MEDRWTGSQLLNKIKNNSRVELWWSFGTFFFSDPLKNRNFMFANETSVFLIICFKNSEIIIRSSPVYRVSV